MSLKMPEFNIFIMMGNQNPEMEEKEVKGKKKKSNPLRDALKSDSDDDEKEVVELRKINNKLRRLPMTSHVGGG